MLMLHIVVAAPAADADAILWPGLRQDKLLIFCIFCPDAATNAGEEESFAWLVCCCCCCELLPSPPHSPGGSTFLLVQLPRFIHIQDTVVIGSPSGLGLGTRNSDWRF
uniref:Putative secreted protein n=1 Tax=Anopheles triannulatus TaxID=58253 RepID=A0A2M4B7K5_9DIPT